MYPQTRQLVQQVAKALTKLPNKLSISGHTDSSPFPAGSGRDNWDLSTERANATRRALLAGGGIALLEAKPGTDLNAVATALKQEGVKVQIELAGALKQPK